MLCNVPVSNTSLNGSCTVIGTVGWARTHIPLERRNCNGDFVRSQRFLDLGEKKWIRLDLGGLVAVRILFVVLTVATGKLPVDI